MKNKKLIILAILIVAVIAISIGFFSKGRKNETKSATITGIKLVDSFKVRPLTDIHYERTAQRLKQGKYLAEGILMCFTCHSPRNMDLPGAPLYDDKKGSGGTLVYEDSTTRLIAPNITPDNETGAGTWTDDMLARSIREGVGHDGRALNWQMPYNIFRNMSDEDLASVIVFLRSLPPVHNVVEQTKYSKEERSQIEKSMRPIFNPVATPDFTDPVKRGMYLVRLGECVGCHTSHSEYNPGIFAGGNFVYRYGHKAFSANLTSHPSGITYGPEAFIFVLRTGKGGALSPAMPWISFKNINDDDLKAIYAYLRSLPPNQHYVSNQQPFTHCEICGEMHGNGDKNKREIPAGIKIDPEQYDQYTGTYQEDEWKNVYILTRKGTKLLAKGWETGPEHELVPQSELRFIGAGLPLPLTFVKDKDGRITELKEETDYGRAFKKIKKESSL